MAPFFRKQSTTSFPGGNRGVSLWRETFGDSATDKEETRRKPVPGGSWGRSAVASSDNAVKRLLEALRSRAPGGWSDNRWEAASHFTGITYIAGHRKYEQMAQAEFAVSVKDPKHPKGKRPVERGHPGYRLIELLERPNSEDSFGDLCYMWAQHLDLYGSALTYIVPNAYDAETEAATGGKKTQSLVGMYNIPVPIAIPQPVINPDYPHGYYRIQPVYPYGPFSSFPTPNSSVGAAIPAQWMMRFKFPHPLLRWDGYAPLTGIRLHLDEVESIDRSRWYSMRRSVNPSAVLNMTDMEGSQPLPEPEILRILAEWEKFQGEQNHGRIVVTPPGGKMEIFGNKPLEMDYAEGWNQLVSFCMAGLGITKPAAGMIEDASYASLFATLKQLHLLTLEPTCHRIEAKVTRDVAPFFADDLIVDVRCQRVDDHEVTQSRAQLLAEKSAITYNQLLEMLGQPTTDEPWGKERVGMDQQSMEMEQAKKTPAFGGGIGNGKKPPNKMETADADMEKANEDMETASGEKTDEQKLAATAPKPGKLSRGALGPRKALLKGFKKTKSLSFYDRVRKVIGNGHA